MQREILFSSVDGVVRSWSSFVLYRSFCLCHKVVLIPDTGVIVRCIVHVKWKCYTNIPRKLEIHRLFRFLPRHDSKSKCKSPGHHFCINNTDAIHLGGIIHNALFLY
jgi:hypothetical protein